MGSFCGLRRLRHFADLAFSSSFTALFARNPMYPSECGVSVAGAADVSVPAPRHYVPGAGNSPVSLDACLPNASVLGVCQLRVGSGIQQRNWSLSRRAAAASPASCRRMGGFLGPKRSFLVDIILAIKLDQVERDQGGAWKAPRAYAPFRRASACRWS